MRFGNYLCLLMGIVVTRAQDDNPSGHEVILHDSLTMTTGTSSLDDSLTTTTGTSSLDDSLTRTTGDNVSNGNQNVLRYNLLLLGFLFL